jgi:hypothetical protein
MVIGQTAQLSAKATLADGTIKDLGDNAAWQSSNVRSH